MLYYNDDYHNQPIGKHLMGQRANLVLVDENGYQLYYNHWCANRLDSDLFWGPELAIEYIKQQQPTEQWLDEVWAEGGVVLDTHKKVLLWYGGESILYEIPLRRLYLKLMKHVWKGWEIRWAHDGILDMADYVGVPRSVVVHSRLGEPDRQFRPPSGKSFSAPEKLRHIQSVGSIRLSDGSIRVYPSDRITLCMLKYGKLLIEAIRSQLGVAEWHQHFNQSLKGGFHIDFMEKKLSVWRSYSIGAIHHIVAHWPGWQIDWLRDDFETHIALTENCLTLDVPSESELLPQLEGIPLREPRKSKDFFKVSIEHMKKGGGDVRINPHAFHDNPPETGLELRKKIFQDAVNAWKKSESGDSK
jgi:hypothetical protein